MIGYDSIVMLVVSALASFVAVNWAYFKVLRIAKVKGLVDNPDARKLQKRPIPVVGGIAVFFGIVSGMLVASSLAGFFGIDGAAKLLAVICVMSVMLYTGAMDDIMGLTPSARFVMEILSIVALIYASDACIDSFHSLWGIGAYSWWIAVPLTVFAGVGIINAVNMIDGVNGLSSGLCMLWCVCFGIMFAKTGDAMNATLAIVMACSILPFYVHNVFGLHSRMFMGDAGTMVMGILMTWFTISLLRSDGVAGTMVVAQNVNMIAFALAVLSVPVFDTLRVMTMRILKKQSPFHPDKTHLHHVFINIGVSHFITASCILLVNMSTVLVWFILVQCGASMQWQLYGVIMMSVLFVWGTYAFLRYHTNHHTKLLHRMTHFSVRTHLGRTDRWQRITTWLDAPELRQAEQMVEENKVQHVRKTNRFEHIDPNNHKEQDRKKLIDYLKGKAEVHVEDIEKHSGVEPLRLYSLLFEEEQGGYITVVKHSVWGAPEIVYLNE